MANGPTSREVNSGKTKGRLENAVQLWPTPRAQEAKHGPPTEWELQTSHAGTKDSLRVHAAKKELWPTPDATPRGATPNFTGTRPSGAKESFNLETATKMFPTMDVGAAKGRGLKSAENRHRLGGSLNPMWVAWLMGYPLEFLNSVPWETPSSRKSRKK